jgi:putative methyltransferase (TIGR04325 family)
MKTIKKLIRAALTNTPGISDAYQAYWQFPRTPNAFRGVFHTFSEAEQAIPGHLRLGYNVPELHGSHAELSGELLSSFGESPAAMAVNSVYIPSVNQTIKFGKHPLFRFHQSDYPLLLWLNNALKDSLRVFDLGGSLGFSYYTYGIYISYPEGLKWISCDVNEAVIAGKELVKELNLGGLEFTTNFSDANGVDILLTCGTLQYIEPALAVLLKTLDVMPQHLLVNQVPLYDFKQYVTIQNLTHSYVPYKIQNRSEFIKGILDLGYKLVDSWHDQRTCSVPFYPAHSVNGYHGFYFRLP